MSSSAHESILYKDLLGSDEMREIFSDNEIIAAYLEVERALAKVQAELGIIPQEAAIVAHAYLANIDLDRYEKRIGVVSVHQFCLLSRKSSLSFPMVSANGRISARRRRTSWTPPSCCRSARRFV